MKTQHPNWLTWLECRTLLYLAQGTSFKWAAYKMGISEGAARNYAANAYRKLGVHDRFEAVERHPYHAPKPSRMCHIKNALGARETA